jgi:CheY-like chemotaxis protein
MNVTTEQLFTDARTQNGYLADPVPDATLQFEAARTLAQAGGDPPYRGSSRVVEILLQAATSTGEEIAVVAHPDEVVREELATNLSRFGYRIEKVASGRDAIFAARANIDTVLVVIGARTVRPTALETVQFIQRQAVGDVPPVLVVVDPLDDDGRGCFLSQLIMKFADLHGVAIVDRLDSFFKPVVDEATGDVAQALGDQVQVVVVDPDGGKFVGDAESDDIFGGFQAHDRFKPHMENILREERLEVGFHGVP